MIKNLGFQPGIFASDYAGPYSPQWLRAQKKPIVVYGAGTYGKRVYEYLSSFEGLAGKITGFIDGAAPIDESPISLSGLPVRNPASSEIAAQNPLAILSAWDIGQISEMKNTCDKLQYESFPYQWIYLYGNPDVMTGLDLLADDESRETYRSILRFYLRQDLAEIVRTDNERMYFPSFVPVEHSRAIVDGGAYAGNSFMRFRQVFGNDLDRYYAIEPDVRILETLKTNASSHGDRVRIVNCALSDKRAVLKFARKLVGCSSLGEEGDVEVQVDTVDNIVGDDSITLIKFDIEGEELKALDGARNTIVKNKPALSICVYHMPDHLWEVPRWIKKANPDYQLFIRHHTVHQCDTVCYAIPK